MRTSTSGRSAVRLSPVALALVVVALLLGSTGGAVAGALITGAQIKDGTVTGADIKTGSLTGADVKNGSLSYIELAGPPKAWGAMTNATTNDFTAATWTPLVSKALTTTAAGYLTVTGSLYAEDDFSLAGVGRLSYDIRVDGKVVNARKVLSYADAGAGENGAATIVVPVTKGAHTVQIVVRESGSGSFLYGGEISAVYTPAGSSSGLALVAGRQVHPRAANR